MRLAALAVPFVLALAGCSTDGPSATPPQPEGPQPGANATLEPLVFERSGTFQAGTGAESPVASGCMGHTAGAAIEGSSLAFEVPEGYANATVNATVVSPHAGASYRLCLYMPGDVQATVTGMAPLTLSTPVPVGKSTATFLPDNSRPGVVVAADFTITAVVTT